MAAAATKYDFSFTGFSLRPIETRKVAVAKCGREDFDAVSDVGGGKSSTAQRVMNALNKRLEKLTPDQTNLLIHGDLTTQKQIAFLGVCKAHSFIRDFVVEVLREKLLVFDYKLTEGDYITFYRRKCDQHPELEDLAVATRKKINQVTFKILEQAGLIDDVKSKVIQPQFLENRVVQAIVKEDANWLKVFLLSDLEISNLMN